MSKVIEDKKQLSDAVFFFFFDGTTDLPSGTLGACSSKLGESQS